MSFSLKDLQWAVDEQIITAQVRDSLVQAFAERDVDKPSLTFAHVLYYLGGLTIISALSIYLTLNWALLAGWQHFGIGLGYGVSFWGVGHWLWRQKGLIVPGGILITAAVCMTSMAVYGVQEMTGWWMVSDPRVYRDFYNWIHAGWGLMEVVTIVVGIVAVRYYKFPFIVMPIAFCLWFMSMDLTAIIYGPDFSWDQRKYVSISFGLVMLFVSFIVDRRTRQDFAFWGYLFGMITFWGGLTVLDSSTELGKFLYCLINLGLIMLAVILERNVFIVFGSLGVMLYVGHLAGDLFKNEVLFTFAMTGVGLAIIAIGVFFHRHGSRMSAGIINMLPSGVKRHLPQNRS